MGSARRATDRDVATLVDLATAEHRELGAERGGAMWVAFAQPPTPDRFARAIVDPQLLVLAGTYDEVVFGFATARLADAPGVGRVATIDDLFVDAQARQVGIGAALIESVIAWAQQHHCVGVDATVLPGTREAKNFFEAHGLVARAIAVHRRLDARTRE